MCRIVRCAPAFALLALILSMACTPARDERARLVLLYATCTVNCRYLSPYDHGVDYTPSLAAFERHATTFAKHQTEAGDTRPGKAATSRSPRTRG